MLLLLLLCALRHNTCNISKQISRSVQFNYKHSRQQAANEKREKVFACVFCALVQKFCKQANSIGVLSMEKWNKIYPLSATRMHMCWFLLFRHWANLCAQRGREPLALFRAVAFKQSSRRVEWIWFCLLTLHFSASCVRKREGCVSRMWICIATLVKTQAALFFLMTPMLFLCQKYHKREPRPSQPTSWGLPAPLQLMAGMMMMSLPSALRLKCCSCYFIKKLPVSALCGGGFLSNGWVRFREFAPFRWGPLCVCVCHFLSAFINSLADERWNKVLPRHIVLKSRTRFYKQNNGIKIVLEVV